jgi:hypothetical protein
MQTDWSLCQDLGEMPIFDDTVVPKPHHELRLELEHVLEQTKRICFAVHDMNDLLATL